MTTLISRAKALVLRLWQSEPVRTLLAPLILAAIVASLAKAGVDGSIAGIVATVALGALGFTAQEIARAKVTPIGKARNAEVAVLHDTMAATRQVLAAELGERGTQLGDQILTTARQYVGQHRR